MKRIAITLAAIALAALGCQQSGPTGPTNSMSSVGKPMFTNSGNNGNGVIHRASVGGHDVDISYDPGDKNFSLIAVQRADGSVSGEWTDMFGQGLGGIHVEVDCLNVSDDSATVSGIVKNGEINGVDITGQRALTRVWDGGKNTADGTDYISFSYTGPLLPNCSYAGPLPALVMTKGQVTVD